MSVEIPTNAGLLRRILTTFIKNEVEKVGVNRVVLGLSGGVDSSLSALLAAEALGAKNVLGIMMPYKTSSPESRAHAELVVKKGGIEAMTVDISPEIDAYFAAFPDADARRRGNKMARERMAILYDLSARDERLVLGTSNKTEILLGYGTQHGDLASAINPLGDLYKTQVRQVALGLGIPEDLVWKTATADLWKGQTDEQELGYAYADIDRLLLRLVDRRETEDDLVRDGFPRRMVRSLRTRMERSQFKRRPPIIARLTRRAVNLDFRYPRDWNS